jgi:hypothetical protein
MRERGLLGSGPGQYPGSMQGIMAVHPREPGEEGRSLMRQNRSYVFFTELTGDGPLGSIGVPVRREKVGCGRSGLRALWRAGVALELDRPEANGLWVAQDTGGAIKGANRFDTFWGAGRGCPGDRGRDERARHCAGFAAQGHGRAPQRRMSHPRGLTPDEASAWDKVAATVKPIHPVRRAKAAAVPAKAVRVESKPLVAAPAARPAVRPVKTPVAQT